VATAEPGEKRRFPAAAARPLLVLRKPSKTGATMSDCSDEDAVDDAKSGAIEAGAVPAQSTIQYSIVVPIYNDGALARDFCLELASTFRAYLGLGAATDEGDRALARALEVIFVDDGSANDSPQLLKQVCREFPFARAVLLSRNFGQHIAISAGYRAVSGRYVGMLNVDQEDPPSQLPLLFDTLKQGEYDIVGGLYQRRLVRLTARLTSYAFHTLMDRLTGLDTPAAASTMRVMTRSAVDVYNGLVEKSRYLPGLEMWLGLKYGFVPVEHQVRRIGTSSYNFRRRLRLAIASIISFSDYPLKLAVKFGLATAVIGVLLATALVADRLFLRTTFLLPGYTSTLAVIVFLGGAQIAVTGVASMYIGRILGEVQQRPLFVVREIYGGAVRPLQEPVLRVAAPPSDQAAGGAGGRAWGA
jgi:dolichol-phosphate mannosyltransferase